jgi:hypothetical protein
MVPLGPKLVFMTSYSPLAALMFMNRAALRPITSAFGLSVLTDPMATAPRGQGGPRAAPRLDRLAS